MDQVSGDTVIALLPPWAVWPTVYAHHETYGEKHVSV